jgi:hypothetical protein
MPKRRTRQRDSRNFDPETDAWLTDADLRIADPEIQLRVMKYWFDQNYTDPVENTPYESAEGGYQYIWGGPYNAGEELRDNFDTVVPEEVIAQLVEELERITLEWTGNPNEFDVDDYLFDAIGISEVYRASLLTGITTIEQSLSVQMPESLRKNFLRMLYGNVIAAFEAYLFDFFISALKEKKGLVRKLVETNKEFRRRKIILSDIFKSHEQIEETVREFLLGLSWHNLPRIKPLYSEVLEIIFDDEVTRELMAAVAVRHDIVHRNGKTKEGVEVVVTHNDIRTLITKVNTMVKRIEDQWVEKHAPS